MWYSVISAIIILCHSTLCIEEEPGLYIESKNDTMVEHVPLEEHSMPGMKMKMKCCMKEALLSMSDLIKVLTEEVQAIKEQIADRCQSLGGNFTGFNSTIDKVDESLEIMNETDMETNNEKELMSSPKPPIKCELPFQKINESCFSFFNDPSDWKSWGDASVHCQKLDSKLATPENSLELRNYLKENYSNVFWVGARKTEKNPHFEWMSGNKVTEEEWKEGHPTKIAAKFCIFLEFFSGYRAVNHYCGEKFPFICQRQS